MRKRRDRNPALLIINPKYRNATNLKYRNATIFKKRKGGKMKGVVLVNEAILNPIEIRELAPEEVRRAPTKRRSRERTKQVIDFTNKEILSEILRLFSKLQSDRPKELMRYGQKFGEGAKQEYIKIIECDSQKCKLRVYPLIRAAAFSKVIGGEFGGKKGNQLLKVWYPPNEPSKEYAQSFLHEVLQAKLLFHGWYKLKNSQFVKFFDERKPKDEELYPKKPSRIVIGKNGEEEVAETTAPTVPTVSEEEVMEGD